MVCVLKAVPVSKTNTADGVPLTVLISHKSKKLTYCASVAKALANNVFPFPGGPNSNNPKIQVRFISLLIFKKQKQKGQKDYRKIF